MQDNIEYICAYNRKTIDVIGGKIKLCDKKFSYLQAVRDTITVKEGGKVMQRKIIQCPQCGRKVKRGAQGWVADIGRLN